MKRQGDDHGTSVRAKFEVDRSSGSAGTTICNFEEFAMCVRRDENKNASGSADPCPIWTKTRGQGKADAAIQGVKLQHEMIGNRAPRSDFKCKEQSGETETMQEKHTKGGITRWFRVRLG